FKSFHFSSGFGLSIFAVGVDCGQALKQLMAMSHSEAGKAVRLIFQRLGQGCLDSYRLHHGSVNASAVGGCASAVDDEHEQLRQETKRLRQELIALSEMNLDLREKCAQYEKDGH